jgi:hypothetical protein
LETEVYQARFKSRFDDLSIPRTLWIFRRTVLVCLAVYTGYVCEGFEVGHPLELIQFDHLSVLPHPIQLKRLV